MRRDSNVCSSFRAARWFISALMSRSVAINRTFLLLSSTPVTSLTLSSNGKTRPSFFLALNSTARSMTFFVPVLKYRPRNSSWLRMWSASAMSVVTFLPSSSSKVHPKSFSADGENITMLPARVIPTTGSGVCATMASTVRRRFSAATSSETSTTETTYFGELVSA